jgi:lipopolysaccharide/colanic/teichoic acid biosynthesis glycosyltransferase
MIMRNVLSWLGAGHHRNGQAEPEHLHSPERLRFILERERMRSDRSGREFSLLAIKLGEEDRSNGGLRRLADIVHQRLRITDDAGHLDDGRIGVVLPETPAQGAWLVADEICKMFEAKRERLTCDVYVYPPQDHSSDHHESNGSNNGHYPSRHVESLERFFEHPLPAWKRGVDILGACVLLVLLSPIMLAAAIVVKLTSRGPVLFSQRRDGIGGRPFTIYKFRTMHVDAEAKKAELRPLSEQDGPAFKLHHDPRITPLGRLLRRTCIDELPQLWNVLRGDMSLVGPRPLPCDESRGCDGWQRRRLDVTPGLTCIWQVDGGSKVTFAEWMRMDIRYITTRKFWRDAKLLLKTAVKVVMQRASH